MTISESAHTHVGSFFVNQSSCKQLSDWHFKNNYQTGVTYPLPINYTAILTCGEQNLRRGLFGGSLRLDTVDHKAAGWNTTH